MSIKRRGGDEDANYFYRFTYKGHDYCEGGFRTSAQANEAQRLAKNLAINKKLSPDDYAGEMSVRMAVEWWLKNYAPTKRSQKNDIARLNLAADYFDDKLIPDVTPQNVDDFLGALPKLRNAASPRKSPYIISDHTRNHYRASLHALYERLKFKRMYKGDNPVDYVDKIDVPTARVRFIYPAEETILTPAVMLEPDIFAYYLVGTLLGPRIGEMRELKVKHVDFTMKHVFIEKSKNYQSRYVPFDEEMRDPNHLVLSLFESLSAGKEPDDFLLPHWGYTYIAGHFRAICDLLGIKNVTPHIWRHTFAYTMLSQGEPLYRVSKLMGHSSQSVTEKHYGHLAAADLRNVVPTAKSFLSCNRIATAIPVSTRKY